MRLGAAAVGRPRATIAVWAIATLVLVLEGLSFGDRIAPSSLNVPGSSSAHAQQLADRYFGTEASVPVLLQGPRSQVDEQGRRLVAALRKDSSQRVLSPWDGGQLIPELRPRKDAALVLVVAQTTDTFSSQAGREVRRTVKQTISRPVRASVSGFSVVGSDLKDASLAAAHDAERLAIPVLLLVLLLVFRSPIAALIPAVFGIAAVESGYGAVSLLARIHPISDVATTLTSMMGLALGIDYSLLLVSRFREELAAGHAPAQAALVAQRTAGRTVLFAGVTLIIAMLAAIALSPGDFLFSAAASVATVAVVSMAGSFLAAPAMLTAVGHRIDRWRIGGVPKPGGSWAALARGVQRRPVLWGGLALLPLLTLSVPGLGLDTGPPDVRALPVSSQARQDAQRVADVLGSGWATPFEVYLVDPSGPITTKPRLQAMAGWQAKVARWPGVDTVIGPGAIATKQPSLLQADRTVAATQRRLARSRKDAAKLSAGLARAGNGVQQLRGGLRAARTAADRLSSGADSGQAGARRLAAALKAARDGARQLTAGVSQAAGGAEKIDIALGQASTGAGALSRGIDKSAAGAGKLRRGAGQLADGLRRGGHDLGALNTAAGQATDDVQALTAALNAMSVGKADPRYRAAAQAAGKLSAFLTGNDPRTGQRIDPAYPGLTAALTDARSQLEQASAAAATLSTGAGQLRRGLLKLRAGTRTLRTGLLKLHDATSQLRQGLKQLSTRGTDLPKGLDQLVAGADKLADGLAGLQNGNQKLADGLQDGSDRTATLQTRLDGASRRTADAGTNPAGSAQLDELRDRSPRLLDSGYFVLAALDGSKPGPRTQAGFAVNLQGGGQAARITVIPKGGANDPVTRRLNDQLNAAMPALAKSTHAQAATAGVAAQVTDYQRALGGRLPWLIAALSLVTTLVLIILLRAIVLPIISVTLNLLTVGASFGVVALCFNGHPPLMGGPGWADILSLLATFTIIFALSLDYQVFILTRMRESWLTYRQLEPAVTHAIDSTGRVVTGAAAIMGAVFIAFTTADLTIVTQTGVGLATAVLIDATLVRLVLLPAVMSLAGPATFWLPGWLDRRLPDLDLEGHNGPAAAPA
jgi:RND superfamily putative drug exporter